MTSSCSTARSVNTTEVLSSYCERNLTVNQAKCAFNKTSIEYFGHEFSAKWISASPKKVEAVHKAGPPSDASEVRSLLGLATYTPRFIPDFATLTLPLRELTRADVSWCWNKDEQDALDKLKEHLTSETTMAYFSLNRNTEIYADASPVGLAAVLVQRDAASPHKPHIVAYASRALTPTEQNYPQIDREALAIVWGIEHFHLYVYGSHVTVITDHKPLEAIWNNPRSKLSARLEKWSLRLQTYDLKIRYEPGRNNPADWMSRHPLPDTSESERSSKAAY